MELVGASSPAAYYCSYFCDNNEALNDEYSSDIWYHEKWVYPPANRRHSFGYQ